MTANAQGLDLSDALALISQEDIFLLLANIFVASHSLA